MARNDLSNVQVLLVLSLALMLSVCASAPAVQPAAHSCDLCNTVPSPCGSNGVCIPKPGVCGYECHCFNMKTGLGCAEDIVNANVPVIKESLIVKVNPIDTLNVGLWGGDLFGDPDLFNLDTLPVVTTTIPTTTTTTTTTTTPKPTTTSTTSTSTAIPETPTPAPETTVLSFTTTTADPTTTEIIGMSVESASADSSEMIDSAEIVGGTNVQSNGDVNVVPPSSGSRQDTALTASSGGTDGGPANSGSVLPSSSQAGSVDSSSAPSSGTLPSTSSGSGFLTAAEGVEPRSPAASSGSASSSTVNGSGSSAVSGGSLSSSATSPSVSRVGGSGSVSAGSSTAQHVDTRSSPSPPTLQGASAGSSQ